MDFTEIKNKALELKNKAANKIEDAIDYSAKKLSESKLTISTKEEIIKLIEKSKTSEYINKETGEKKYTKHKSIIIIGDEKTDFFKKALINFPVLVTKAFSQNINLKLAKSVIEGVDYKDYEVKTLPALIIFKEKEVYKIIEGEENIEKLVKSFDLDINKLIEQLNK